MIDRRLVYLCRVSWRRIVQHDCVGAIVSAMKKSRVTPSTQCIVPFAQGFVPDQPKRGVPALRRRHGATQYVVRWCRAAEQTLTSGSIAPVGRCSRHSMLWRCNFAPVLALRHSELSLTFTRSARSPEKKPASGSLGVPTTIALSSPRLNVSQDVSGSNTQL